MKKKFLSLLFLACMGGVSPLFADGIDLHVGYVDPVPGTSGHGKQPAQKPSLWQEGHQIAFMSDHSDYDIDIILEGVVVYSVSVSSTTNSFTLPSWLEGTYEIDLYGGGIYYFYGEIEL